MRVQCCSVPMDVRAFGEQKRELDLPEREVQVVLAFLILVLGTKLQSSEE